MAEWAHFWTKSSLIGAQKKFQTVLVREVIAIFRKNVEKKGLFDSFSWFSGFISMWRGLWWFATAAQHVESISYNSKQAPEVVIEK